MIAQSARRSVVALIAPATRPLSLAPSDFPPSDFLPPPARRDRLWELSTNLHCSIIGTCLGTSDLRALMSKLGVPRAGEITEHDLHAQAVSRAGRKDDGGKLLHKLLDRRHARDIQLFDRAETTGRLRGLWKAALERGEIPGAYWAVLTHPLADRDLVREVFGEVHMLSHLVGRSVRADLRRLAELEAEAGARLDVIAELEARVAALTRAKADAEQREAGRERDLRDVRLAPTSGNTRADDGETIAHLRERLDRAEAKAALEVERRIEAEGVARRLAETVRDGAKREDALRHELESLEGTLGEPLDDGPPQRAGRLAGLTLLYVGGRPRQVAQARLAVRNRGGELLAHDGGVEESTTLLPGLVSRSDVVLLPVDCVSHDAAGMLKRCCRDYDRTFMPLRSASLASLLVALETLRETPRQATALGTGTGES